MINISNTFDDITDFDRSLFVSALDKHLSDLPHYYEIVSRRVKVRESITSLKEKINANVQEFSYEELDLFLEALRFYRDDPETYTNLDEGSVEQIQVSMKRYTRRLDDFLYDLRK